MRPSSPNAKARPSAPGQGNPARPTSAPPPATPIETFVVHEEPAHEELTPEQQALAHDAEVAAEADAVGRVVEDDDTLNLPAPSPEMLAHRPAPPKRPQRELLSRTVGFKQTLIPILFVMGILTAGLGAYSFVLGEESPIAAATWIPMVLIATGALLLLFLAVTMLQVHNQLKKQA
jgi:hypothetical protein